MNQHLHADTPLLLQEPQLTDAEVISLAPDVREKRLAWNQKSTGESMASLFLVDLFLNVKYDVTEFVGVREAQTVSGDSVASSHDDGLSIGSVGKEGARVEALRCGDLTDPDTFVLEELAHVLDRIEPDPPLLSKKAGRNLSISKVSNQVREPIGVFKRFRLYRSDALCLEIPLQPIADLFLERLHPFRANRTSSCTLAQSP